MVLTLIPRILLIGMLGVGLTKPVRATTFETDGRLLYAGIGIVSAAIGLTIVLIVHHKSGHVKATGCVHPGAAGMELADEGSNRSYMLAGDLTGVADGNRISVEGRRQKKTSTFRVRKLDENYGPCRSIAGASQVDTARHL